MVVPDRVVKHELVVPAAPVVSDLVFVVDDQGVDIEHFQTGSGSQTSLAGTCRLINLVQCRNKKRTYRQ